MLETLILVYFFNGKKLRSEAVSEALEATYYPMFQQLTNEKLSEIDSSYKGKPLWYKTFKDSEAPDITVVVFVRKIRRKKNQEKLGRTGK